MLLTLAVTCLPVLAVAWLPPRGDVGTEAAGAAAGVARPAPPPLAAASRPKAARIATVAPDAPCFREEPTGTCFEVCAQFVRAAPSPTAPPVQPRGRSRQPQSCDRYPDAVGRIVPLTGPS